MCQFKEFPVFHFLMAPDSCLCYNYRPNFLDEGFLLFVFSFDFSHLGMYVEPLDINLLDRSDPTQAVE